MRGHVMAFDVEVTPTDGKCVRTCLVVQSGEDKITILSVIRGWKHRLRLEKIFALPCPYIDPTFALLLRIQRVKYFTRMFFLGPRKKLFLSCPAPLPGPPVLRSSFLSLLSRKVMEKREDPAPWFFRMLLIGILRVVSPDPPESYEDRRKRKGTFDL